MDQAQGVLDALKPGYQGSARQRVLDARAGQAMELGTEAALSATGGVGKLAGSVANTAKQMGKAAVRVVDDLADGIRLGSPKLATVGGPNLKNVKDFSHASQPAGAQGPTNFLRETPKASTPPDVTSQTPKSQIFVKNGKNEITSQPTRKSIDYSSIKNPPEVGPGKEFTLRQKQEALSINRKLNSGEVRSDQSGITLVKPQKSRRGVTPDPREWQFDHKTPKSCGGTNCSSNLQILSREENRIKSDKVK